jgi:hypothetical protein
LLFEITTCTCHYTSKYGTREVGDGRNCPIWEGRDGTSDPKKMKKMFFT